MITNTLDPKKAREIIGLQLRAIRLEQNISLEQASHEAKLHLRQLRRIENGRGYSFCFFRRLLKLYNKRIEINVVD